MKILAVIPARYASTRFPGKPLALLGGRPIIDYAYGVAAGAECVAKAVVATDDERIFSHMKESFGEESVMMTSTEHKSGTDRCGEVMQKLMQRGEHYDVVINLQGDEPFVKASQLESLAACFERPETAIATLKTRITSSEELASPNNVKVVCAADGRALYFSRQPIPYRRDIPLRPADTSPKTGEDYKGWLQAGDYFKHVGIYAFRSQVLAEVCKLPQSPLECSEKLEQLRWLEAGYTIAVRETPCANIGIDTPEDLAAAEREMRTKN
jgi:3-deoxy-manno-octulosonate cytidylyltransferase (CMP-KDO synthetase)